MSYHSLLRLARRSAVAVIADRTACAYVVRYTGSQTSFSYKFTNGWYARSDSTGRVYERARTLHPLRRDQYWPFSVTDHVQLFPKSENLTEHNIDQCTPDCLSRKLTFTFSSIRFLVCFVAKRYILQQKCLNGQIGTWLLGTCWYNL